MRRICWVVVALTLSGCSDDAFVHTPEERARFDARIERDMAAAKRRRAHQLAANARALDEIRPVARARYARETHQGLDDSNPDELGEDEIEYEIYLSENVRPYSRFELVTAERWATYRVYRLPPTSTTRAAFDYYNRLFADWLWNARERGTHADGHSFYADDYRRDGRCVWIHIGFSDQPPIPSRLSLMVATVAGPADAC